MEILVAGASVFGVVFGVSFVLALRLGGSKILVAGAVVGFPVPFVLAAWDPDGSSGGAWDFSRSNWFVVGLIGGVLLYAGWALGVAAAAIARQARARRIERRPIH